MKRLNSTIQPNASHISVCHSPLPPARPSDGNRDAAPPPPGAEGGAEVLTNLIMDASFSRGRATNQPLEFLHPRLRIPNNE